MSTEKDNKQSWDILRHDMKNEVAVIKAFAELIRRSKDSNENLKRYAEKINDKGNKLITLINKVK